MKKMTMFSLLVITHLSLFSLDDDIKFNLNDDIYGSESLRKDGLKPRMQILMEQIFDTNLSNSAEKESFERLASKIIAVYFYSHQSDVDNYSGYKSNYKMEESHK